MRRGDRDQEDRHRDVPGIDDDARVAHEAEGPDDAQDRGQHRQEHALQAPEGEDEHDRDHEEGERDVPRHLSRLLALVHGHDGLAREVEVDRTVVVGRGQGGRAGEDRLVGGALPEVEDHEGRPVVGCHEEAAELRIILDPGAEERDRLGRARHVAHQVVDGEHAVDLLDVAHARRGEAHDVRHDDVRQPEGGDRHVLDHLEDLGPPDVALARHDGDDHRVASAEIAADLVVDTDERVVGGQTRLQVELGVEPAEAGDQARRRHHDGDHDGPRVSNQEACVPLTNGHGRNPLLHGSRAHCNRWPTIGDVR